MARALGHDGHMGYLCAGPLSTAPFLPPCNSGCASKFTVEEIHGEVRLFPLSSSSVI